MEGISELAKMFKERESIKYMGPIVGTVLSPPPEIKIQIDKNIILDKGNLVVGASILKEYKRKIIIEGEKIKFNQSNPPTYIGTTDSVNDGGMGASSHTHKIVDININIPVRIEATKESSYIETTDTINEGDKVILIPSQDEQIYFLIDWAVRL